MKKSFPSIALIGYMGSGKSSVGQRLAQLLSLDWVDLDREVEKQWGESIAELVERHGEVKFRRMEAETLEKIVTRGTMVLSTGGGTPCYGANLSLLLQNTRVVFLQWSVPSLVRHVQQGKAHRPLLSEVPEEKLPDFIGPHLLERNAFYQEAHDTEVCREGDTPEAIALRIAQKMKEN